jgi:hypothetical protein
MKNLKRLRVWLIEVSGGCWSYLRHVTMFRSMGPAGTGQPDATVTLGSSSSKYDPAVVSDQTAQRLARLLVSEIKLYYMSKIEDQQAGTATNIYDLLRDPIDKSRRHYKKRLGAKAAASMPDYFHGELVSSLCAGDASRLGPNYPRLNNSKKN